MKILRARIDRIDQEMLDLFEERMALVKEVAIYKDKHGIAINDPSREKTMKENLLNRLKDRDLTSYYLNFLEKILEVSKAYQREFIFKED